MYERVGQRAPACRGPRIDIVIDNGARRRARRVLAGWMRELMIQQATSMRCMHTGHRTCGAAAARAVCRAAAARPLGESAEPSCRRSAGRQVPRRKHSVATLSHVGYIYAYTVPQYASMRCVRTPYTVASYPANVELRFRSRFPRLVPTFRYILRPSCHPHDYRAPRHRVMGALLTVL